MLETIRQHLLESAETKKKTAATLAEDIERAATILVDCFRSEKKLLVCGNGGSAADAQHFAGELVNRFRFDHPPVPVLALTMDTSTMTSIGNDSSFDHVYSRPVRAFGEPGDVLMVITTSDVDAKEHGHSANLYQALVAAKENKLATIGLVSIKSKRILEQLDCALKVPSTDTPRIQETHTTIIHILCELIERELFPQTH